MTALSGIILCGGASRRMGRDKAWLPIGNETMLQRVARIVAEVCDPVVVIAGKDQEVPPLPGPVLVEHDRHEDRGPVWALELGLACTPGDRPAFACACDMPLLNARIIRLLSSRHRPDHMVVPVVGGVRQPLASIYDRAACAISELKPRSLQALLQAMRVLEIHEGELRTADPQLRSFLRINDPLSYNEALDSWKAERET